MFDLGTTATTHLELEGNGGARVSEGNPKTKIAGKWKSDRFLRILISRRGDYLPAARQSPPATRRFGKVLIVLIQFGVLGIKAQASALD